MSDAHAHPTKKEDVVDESMVQAYMESPNGDGPTDQDRKDYFKARYENVKNTYRVLLLNKEELSLRKDEDAIDKLTKEFRKNYKERTVIVSALRTLGEKIEDKAVPLAAPNA